MLDFVIVLFLLLLLLQVTIAALCAYLANVLLSHSQRNNNCPLG